MALKSKSKARLNSPDEPVTGSSEAAGATPQDACSNENAAQPEADAEVNAEEAAAGKTKKPSSRKSRTKKKPPQLEADASTTGDSVRTADERLKDLPEIPSLKRPPLEPEERTVDADAPPPPSPLPAPLKEPTPSEYVDRGSPIPENYGLDRLVVLPRDPNWIYVYWELKGGGLDRLRFQHSAEIIDNSRWVLRVKPTKELRDYVVDIDLRVGQWYLKVSPDSRLIVDLGFINHQGDFICVLQGNETATPRAEVSKVVDERWIIMREELEQLLRVGGAEALGLPAAQRPSSDKAPRITRSEQPRAAVLFSSYLAHMEKKPE
jgi:uncharacterized protein